MMRLGENSSRKSWMSKVPEPFLKGLGQEKSRSSLIAATYRSNDALGPIINKKKRGRKLSPEEEKEWMTAWRSAGLIQNYGKRAGIVLAARGVGPTTATRILRNRLAREDDLYLSVLRAEREFERTRMFWD